MWSVINYADQLLEKHIYMRGSDQRPNALPGSWTTRSDVDRTQTLSVCAFGVRAAECFTQASSLYCIENFHSSTDRVSFPSKQNNNKDEELSHVTVWILSVSWNAGVAAFVSVMNSQLLLHATRTDLFYYCVTPTKTWRKKWLYNQ